jgi:serine/threonine protein kinase
MSHHSGQRFGKYLLLGRIAIGGMGEVYQCKIAGEEGFEKVAVVKKILPHLTDQEQVVEALAEEARIAALLQHPNIVQVFDFEAVDGMYFLAMEFIPGKDLKAIMEEAEGRNRPLSLEVALYVISEVCAGLEYAHDLKDASGRSLRVVHRDVSPQNILISDDGHVKIVDFGIAKGANRSQTTEVGTLKGKPGYMSPEQANGKTVDHRSDIFSAGIVLYEMVLGRRMYEGNFFQMLAKARSAQFEPAESIRKDLPPRIYAILSRALAKEPEGRYQSAGDMYRDLADCMRELCLRPTAQRLSASMKELFPGESECSSSDQAGSSRAPGPSILLADTVLSNPNGCEGIAPKSGDKKLGLAYEVPATSNLLLPTRTAQRIARRSRKKTGIAALALASLIFLTLLIPFPLHDADNRAGAQNIAPDKNQKITMLLEKARESVKRNRLTLPAKDCAFYYYQEVLKIDPQNEDARQGCSALVNHYAHLAKEHCKRSHYDQSFFCYERILVIDPQSDVARQGYSALADRYAHLAEENFNKSNYNQALSYYERVREIDPQSEVARQGCRAIGSRYASLAEERFKKFSYAQARDYVELGLQAASDHERLLSLRRDLNAPLASRVVHSVRYMVGGS